MTSTFEERRAADGTRPVPETVAPDYGYDDRGAGWVGFAAIMLVFAGALGLIDGIVALSRSSFYVANAHYVFSDLHTWGWIVTIAGALTIVSGLYVVSGSEVARWFGIFMAGLQALAQLLMIQAYPFWSLCVFAIDILVIYGLAVYGGKQLRRQL